jgi:hypothetical protein
LSTFHSINKEFVRQFFTSTFWTFSIIRQSHVRKLCIQKIKLRHHIIVPAIISGSTFFSNFIMKEDMYQKLFGQKLIILKFSSAPEGVCQGEAAVADVFPGRKGRQRLERPRLWSHWSEHGRRFRIFGSGAYWSAWWAQCYTWYNISLFSQTPILWN